MNPPPTSLVDELRQHQAEHAQRCRVMGWLRSLFYLRVEQDTLADVIAHQQHNCQLAHKAEVEDGEAERCLEAVLADGKISPEEVPVVRQALRHVKVSKRVDQELGGALVV